MISSESKIHSISEDSVHFHEASSIDTLVDIVGITIALDDLKLFEEKIMCLPVSVGGGTVSFLTALCQILQVQFFKFLKILIWIFKETIQKEELTTPTGACILVNLTNNPIEYYPSMNVSSIGYGAGQKDLRLF